MSIESQKPELCGNSKQKCLCVYEYLKCACAENVNISRHTSELEVWRCTDRTAYRSFPSLFKGGDCTS